MLPTSTTPSDPFALLMNPEAVVEAMERSDRLGCLQRRICRPLDKPLIPRAGKDEVAAFDESVDGADIELPPEAPEADEPQV